MNIHSDLTFSPRSGTDHNQSSPLPVGGNLDLSGLISPDDTPLPPRWIYISISAVGNTQNSIDLASELPYLMPMTLQTRMYWLFFVFSIAQSCVVLTGSGISCSLTEKFKESLLPWNMFSRDMSLSLPPTLRTAFLKVSKLLHLKMTVMAMLQLIIFFTFQCHSRGLGDIKS